MKTKRYFFNEETEELMILTKCGDDGETEVDILSQLCAYEMEEDEEQEEEELKPKKTIAITGGGVKEKKPGNSGNRLSSEDKAKILDLAAEGKTLPEIAKEIGCSPATVYNVKRAARTDEEDL